MAVKLFVKHSFVNWVLNYINSALGADSNGAKEIAFSLMLNNAAFYAHVDTVHFVEIFASKLVTNSAMDCLITCLITEPLSKLIKLVRTSPCFYNILKLH